VREVATTGRLRVREQSRRRSREATLGALVLALLIVAILWRIATQSTPPLAVHRISSAAVRLSGTPPVLAWPREGQAAVEVEGVGSFGTSGISAPAPIASVAKVMTAYLTLREHPLARGQDGFVMTVTAADVEEERRRVALGQSSVAVRVGERLTERQALEALLLPSANNVAVMLAAHEPGGLTSFVAHMNDTASALGMSSTTYTDPSGFDPDTVSTASDQLRLARVVMREPVFAEIVDEPAAELPVVGRVANYDGLVGEDGYVGVKTGSDRAAGGCLVFAKRITVGGRPLTVLGVVMGQREGSLIDAALTSARRLGDSAAASVRVITVLPAGTSVLTAISADGHRTSVVTEDPVRELGWAGLDFPVKLTLTGAMSRIRAGERLASVSLRGAHPTTTAAVAKQSLGAPSLGWRLRHLL
jgi:D-alanyl-D-alanine carboxypeptidase (penicillin-binding protein 5/6)